MRRRGIILTTVLSVAALGVSTAVGSAAQATPAIELQIAYGNGEGFGNQTYRLRCGPASGTLPDPAAACLAIASDPQMVLSGPGIDHSCPPGTAGVEVRGTYNGQQVDVAFSGCLGGQGDIISRWIALLPSLQQENRVRLGRGIGPLHIGESASAVRALLGPAQTKVGGVDVYRFNWAAGFLKGVPVVYGVGYRASRVVTLISNSIDVTVYGQRVALLTQSSGSHTVLRANGPLKSWHRVHCGGAGALAHSTHRSTTTIIRRSLDHPTVIVSASPAAACAAAAQI